MTTYINKGMDEAKFQILIRALQLSESATQTNEKSPSSKRIYPIDIDGIKQELVITSSFYEHGLEAADYLANRFGFIAQSVEPSSPLIFLLYDERGW